MSEKLYAGLEERDPMALDEAGDFYTKHVMAMTGERLHSKAAIAAELGYRDMRIAKLQQALDMEAARSAEVLAENTKLRELMRAVDEASKDARKVYGNTITFKMAVSLDAMAKYLKEHT